MLVKIKNVQYATNQIGRVLPIAKLTKTYSEKVKLDNGKTEIVEFDSLVLANAAYVANNEIGKGSELDIIVKSDGIKIAKIVKTSKDVLFNSTCTACKTKLTRYKDDLICENDFCYAKTTTPIFRLFCDVLGVEDIDLIKRYIVGFPLKSKDKIEKVRIKDLITLIHHFYVAGAKDTKPREDMLMEVFDATDVRKIRNIEVKLQERLTEQGLTNVELWHILSVPYLDVEMIKHINIRKLTSSKILKSGIASKTKQAIIKNLDKIKMIIRIFDKFKEA